MNARPLVVRLGLDGRLLLAELLLVALDAVDQSSRLVHTRICLAHRELDTIRALVERRQPLLHRLHLRADLIA